MYACGTCGKEFWAGWKARDNHCRSTGHRAPKFECDTCDRCFSSEQARLNYMDAKNHHFNDDYASSEYTSDSSEEGCEEWYCAMCTAYFDTEEECQDHEVQEHFYCCKCERSFVSYNGIKNVRRCAISTATKRDFPIHTFADLNPSSI
jgi:hypothetical protein